MPPAPDRLLTVSAWAGSTNLGDELVLAGLLAKLAARGVGAQVLSVDPPGTEAHHGTTARTLPALLRAGTGRPEGVVLGGGGLLQDETSPFNVPFHLGRTALAAGVRRPVAGIGLGAGPLAGWLGRRLVRTALQRAVGVSVRDQGSVDVLAGFGVGAELAADLAVSLPVPHVEVEGRVAVSLRPWSGGGGLLPVAMRRGAQPATPSWFAPAMATALDDVASATGLGIHFVALQRDRDQAVHKAVAERMRTSATFAAPDVHTVVAEIASCTAVVAMRYHAGIAALLGGRPAVLVGYSAKVPSLALDVPGGMAGLRWDETSLASLPAALSRVLNKCEAVVVGRGRLRHREETNDRMLDRLLEAMASRVG